MTEKPKGRILLVDDDENFRRGMKRQFTLMRTDMSFEISEAASGNEAIALLGNSEVDCILLDYRMPGGTGLDWLSRILAAHKNEAVIMVTGEGSEEVAVNAMKCGAMDYLVKGSITPETLERAVVNAMDKLRMKRTIEDQEAQLLDAEKHRVMIESLGAACHHIGQPATVVSAYLQMMKRQEQTPALQIMIDECLVAAESIENILKKLQDVSTYRTEPYRPAGVGEASRDDERILAI